jgi:plastocyanin
MRRLTTILLVGAMLAVAGCGGDDESSSSSGSSDTATPTPTATATEAASGGAGENLALAADPSALKFDKSALTAKAGEVTITMDNPSDIPHNVKIDAPGAKEGETVGKGEKSVASADLKAGEYTFYCGVPGHRAAGMEGKLTVQ